MSKQKRGSSVDKGGEKKKEKKEGKQTGGGKKRNRVERERNKREIFLAFRRSKLNGLRRKVDSRIESYA